jgi:hypothetical protein
MKQSRSTRHGETENPAAPRALVMALAQAGLLAAAVSMPAAAALVSVPAHEAVRPAFEPMLYIAQIPPDYGTLNSGSGKGSMPPPSGSKGGAAPAPTRPQGGSSPAPKPAPAPDSRNSSR